MDKDSHLQLELFSDGDRPQPQEVARLDNPLLQFLRACEKKAWAAVTFIIVALVAFAAGVEQGRRLGIRTRVQTSRAEAFAATAQREQAAAKDAPAVSKGAYTIQLGTYSNRQYAEDQVRVLKQKGFQAVLVKDGRHLIVCVGAFPNREAAVRYAGRFKGMYKSCMIRRL
jgi:hypothetical protein